MKILVSSKTLALCLKGIDFDGGEYVVNEILTPDQRTSIEFIILNPIEENFVRDNYREEKDTFDIVITNVDENVKLWRSHYDNIVELLKLIENHEEE